MLEHAPQSEIDSVTAALVERGLGIVDEKYGPESLDPRDYHNRDHSESVFEAVSLLADLAIARGLIKPSDKRLMQVAAAYHDTEQGLSRGENERSAANLALEHMKETEEYSEEEYQKVEKMIMSSVVFFDSDGKMHQSATEDYLTQLFADADLANLGRSTPVYLKSTMNIYREINAGNITDQSYQEFMSGQVGFIANHNFYTEEAKELFPNKPHNQAAAEAAARALAA